MNSKEFFNKIKNNQIKFDDALKKQKNVLSKLNDVKMGKKTFEQKKWLPILKIFTCPERKFLIFLKIKLKWMLVTKQNKVKSKEQDLKY